MELFENIYLDLFYTYAMVGTARAAVRMAAVSAAVIRFFVLIMLFPPFSVFVGILANNTISNKEKKVDRELQSKTEKSESKNEAFYIVTMRGFWEMWFIS